MKPIRAIAVSSVSLTFFLLLVKYSSATTCIELPPLKPVHSICGVVFFPNGDRIANANVAVLQRGNEIAAQQTSNDGKFSFDHLVEGKYKIQVRVEAVRMASTEVILIQPKVTPKQEIAVNMSLQGCSSFSIVNSRKFEAKLNPYNP
jgi:hypothetical protein